MLRCAKALLGSWDEWVKFLRGVYENIDTKESQMASKCLQVIQDPKLKCELEFVVAFGDSFFSKHFAWLHRIDMHTKKSGFCAHEIGPRLAIMNIEIKKLRDTWEQGDGLFASCVKSLNELPPDKKDSNGNVICAGRETALDQFKDFFDHFIAVADDNLRLWKKALISFSIASTK